MPLSVEPVASKVIKPPTSAFVGVTLNTAFGAELLEHALVHDVLSKSRQPAWQPKTPVEFGSNERHVLFPSSVEVHTPSLPQSHTSGDWIIPLPQVGAAVHEVRSYARQFEAHLRVPPA